MSPDAAADTSHNAAICLALAALLKYSHSSQLLLIVMSRVATLMHYVLRSVSLQTAKLVDGKMAASKNTNTVK